MFEKALKEYPEYFPEEVDARNKWNSVPENIKENYYKESTNLYIELTNKLHCQKGIFWRIDNPKEAFECDQLDKPLWDQFYKENKLLHEKYGIETFENL